MATLEQRWRYIQSKVTVVGDCWVYPTEGRGYLTVGGKPELVYRIAYEAMFGPPPAGLYILHKCDNKRCCNPLHLEPGTQRENVKQAVERGLMKSTTGVPGVSYQSARKRWVVMPRINGQKVCLYQGKDFFEAVCALRSWQATVIIHRG